MRNLALILLLCSICGCGQVQYHAVAIPDAPLTSGVMHIGGAVHPPTVIHSNEPELSDEAKALHKGVSAQVYLWVGTDGIPSHIRIVQSANMGAEMDQRILDSMSQYRFKPATLNGAPVTVDLYMGINMDVF